MKRQLDEQEIEMTNKGIVGVQKRMDDIKLQIDFNEKTIAFQKAQNEYQDAIRPYLKQKKEEEDKKVMGALKETLAREEDSLKNMQDQLEKGVEIREITETE